MLRRARLYVHTLRHLKPWQIAGRVLAGGRRQVGFTRISVPPTGFRGGLQAAAPFPQHDPWNTPQALLKGRFTFLNRTEDLGWPLDWDAAHLPLLWRFNLHYFHYLYLLAPAEQEALCGSWVQDNPVGTGVGGYPYPTALRVVNWCRANVQDADLQANLYQQTAYLYRNLETYIYGNHLLENARALVVAGCFFGEHGEAPRWIAKGLQLYRRETLEQVLPDGGHYERSPMYHALMLEGYLDVMNCLPPEHPERAMLAETVKRMSDVLVSLMHPDGHLALFNDATQDIAPLPRALLDYARALTGYEPKQRSAFPETGYYVHRDDDLFLMIDGGPVGPDYLLAHAHADIFSYELSVAGQPFVVDSGVYEYQAGDMRDYVRSTAAHNTVNVDGIDQVECWSSFRVARRFAPHDVTFTRTKNDGSCFEGTFSGYTALIGDGIRHRRCVRVDRTTRRITVEDTVEGHGSHCVESRIHLHPAVALTEAGDALRLHREAVTCRLEIEASDVRWEDGWYCPCFGVRQPNKVLVLGGSTPLPSRLVYHIRY